MLGMDVLSSRILIRPVHPERSRAFYRDILGLAVYREFGPPDDPGLVFFLGGGMLEVSGRADAAATPTPALWVQVRDVTDEHRRLVTAGVPVRQAPRLEPWGLIEMWIEDPDGLRIVLVQVPADHPLRRDQGVLTGQHRGPEESGEHRYEFQPLPRRGGVVSNALIDRLRDIEAE
jgi:catechol 2,3-dioxygenase-like lactoylglutathione lyase family enzyme